MKRVALIVLATALLLPLSTASAANIEVTRVDDPVPDGCTAGSCSLREAVIKANSTGAEDTIVLKATTYSLTRVGDDDDADAGDLDVTEPVRLAGKRFGRSVIRTTWPAGTDAMFWVHPGASINGAGVTLRDNDFDQGSAIWIEDGATVRLRNARILEIDSQYGAIAVKGGTLSMTRSLLTRNDASACCPAFYSQNDGRVTLRKVAIVDNTAGDDTGAVYSDGASMTIRDSLFAGNRAGDVGGALISTNGVLTISNTTFSDNRTDTSGGGIFVEQGSTTRLNNVTITDNVADADGENDDGDGGGIYDSGGPTSTIVLANTIVAGNRDVSGEAPDCGADTGDVFTSLGFNLIGTPLGCDFADRSSDRHGAPGLTGLRDNGGFTETHALKRGSKAVDAGSRAKPGSARPSACEKRDQRGVKRPQGNRCDIGAYERKVRR